jgi:hypothetical protein
MTKVVFAGVWDFLDVEIIQESGQASVGVVHRMSPKGAAAFYGNPMQYT